MNIRQVLGNRVLIKQLVEEVKEAEQDGVIVSPESINPNYFKGQIVGVGDVDPKMLLKAGDAVLYLKYGYEDLGEGKHIVEVQSLLAVVE